MAKKIPTEHANAYHQALDQVFQQASHIDGSLSGVNLQMRYAPKVGAHVHATARVTHRINVTVNVAPHDDRLD